MPEWQRRAAAATHAALYVLMLRDSVVGLDLQLGDRRVGRLPGLVPLPDLVPKDKALAAVLKAVHVTLNLGLVALVVVHVGAALRHHLVDRDAVLPRMLPFLRRG